MENNKLNKAKEIVINAVLDHIEGTREFSYYWKTIKWYVPTAREQS